MTPEEAEDLVDRLPRRARLVLLSRPFDPGVIHNVRQHAQAAHKPAGLWYACGTEWIRWLSSEMPDYLESEHLVYQIEVDHSRMVVIRTLDDLREFHCRWSVSPRSIDWRAVAKEYDGVEICPYQHDARYSREIAWYYGWDVASGAIWRSRAIKAATLVYADEASRRRAPGS